MSRGRASNRDLSRRKASRKRRIDKEVFWGGPLYDNLHQYSKAKIHCSCPDCSAKFKNKGKRRLWKVPVRNYNISELRRLKQMEEESDN